jgi:hypothetical protein
MTLHYDHDQAAWTFDTPRGARELRDPDGAPTKRQLLWLATRGLLELRDRPGEPFTKLDASLAIDRETERE